MSILNLIKSKIQVRSAYKTREKIKAQYLMPDLLRPSVELTPDMQRYAKELKENGIVCFPEMFVDLADYINNNYFEQAAKEDFASIKPWAQSVSTRRNIETGRTMNLNISFSDRNLESLLFNDQLLGIVYNYFQRQPYYRNLPALAQSEFKENHTIDIQGKFHLDGGLNQTSFMLLTNDITEKDTHMEYALNTNNLPVPYNIDRFSYEDKPIEEKYKIYNLVGKKGTLFIFDAGNGFHRAVYKKDSLRKILHLNLTTGHSISSQREFTGANFGFLKDKKDYVKETIQKLI